MSVNLIMQVANREKTGLKRLSTLLEDPRAKLLAFHVGKLEGSIRHIDDLINPQVETRSLTFDERTVAELNKSWLARTRNRLADATSKLVVNLGNIISVLFDCDPIVEEATELSTNLGKIYSKTLDHIENMNTALKNVESTIFPDEILEHTAILRKEWNDLKLLLQNQITEPIKTSLQEEARQTALKKLGEMIYVTRIPNETLRRNG